MNSATASPTQPSIFISKKYAAAQPTSTAAVAMTSLRLSAEAAFSVVERILRPREPKNSDIQSLTSAPATSTAKVSTLGSTASGRMTFFAELNASSAPMTSISAATTSPERYS